MQNEYGLGKSETFYSTLIAIFNVGATFSGILAGILAKYLPYWYLFTFALFSHIGGFVLYAVSYEGWVILLSKFLSGIFIGLQRTLALSYATSSSVKYVEALQETGEKINDPEVAAGKIRDYLFSAQTIGISLGFFLGPGKHYV